MESETATVEVSSREVTDQSFGHILSNGLPSLYKSAYRLVGNVADAEDAVQDALLAAYTHLNQFRGQAKMSSWVTAIVHNAARMQLRKRLRYVHVSLDEPIGEVQTHSLSQALADCRPNPEDECRNVELTEGLWDFQTQLTPTLRRAFQLRVIDGLSIRETARILGVPHGTVKARSARARKKLTQLMRQALGHKFDRGSLSAPTQRSRRKSCRPQPSFARHRICGLGRPCQADSRGRRRMFGWVQRLTFRDAATRHEIDGETSQPMTAFIVLACDCHKSCLLVCLRRCHNRGQALIALG